MDIYNDMKYKKSELINIEKQKGRKIKFKVSDDNMKVIVYINYNINSTERYVVKYKPSDIFKGLNELNVKFGIMTDEIEELCDSESKEIEALVAEGLYPENDKKDYIFINEKLYDGTVKKFKIDENSLENKNIYFKAIAEKGDIIAEKLSGISGKNGIDVYGNIKYRNIVKRRKFITGKGCITDGIKVIASNRGIPKIINGVFCVNEIKKIKEIIKNTSISDRKNDFFIENIREGCRITAEGIINVKADVILSVLNSKSGIVIGGTVKKSEISAGAFDQQKENYINILKDFLNDVKNYIEELEKCLNEKKFEISEAVKYLSQKFSYNFSKKVLDIISINLDMGILESLFLEALKNKILMVKYFDLGSLENFYKFQEIIEKEIKNLEESCFLSSKINFSCAEDSRIIAGGNILITGNGCFNSNIKTLGKISGLNPECIIKGGCLAAEKGIFLNKTETDDTGKVKLKTNKKGLIKIKDAGKGTELIIGNIRKALAEDEKNIEAYLDEYGQIKLHK